MAAEERPNAVAPILVAFEPAPIAIAFSESATVSVPKEIESDPLALAPEPIAAAPDLLALALKPIAVAFAAVASFYLYRH